MNPTDVAPAKRVLITLAGREWQLVPMHKLTLPESTEAKRLSGGMSLADMEEGIGKADSEAWFAWLFVSIRRQWPTLTVKDLEAAIGDIPLLEVIESVKVDDPEGHEVGRPPDSAPQSGADNPTSEDGSSEKTQAPSTPGTSGSPLSPTQT